MNIRFERQGQIRLVKHGYSWTFLFFGWIVFLFRSQFLLALGHFFVSGIAIWILSAMFISELRWMINPGSAFAIQMFLALLVNAVLAIWANRFSGRWYVKNDWRPLDEFPMSWNTPPLIRRTDQTSA